MRSHTSKWTRTLSIGLVAAAIAGWPENASTQGLRQWTEWGAIQNLEGGWGADTLTIRHSPTFVNPGVCSVTNVGYATDPSDTGRGLYHALALSAFMNRKEVAILLQGCVFDKPRIIAVSVR